jgi:tRNA(Ile)-lysidine synthase
MKLADLVIQSDIAAFLSKSGRVAVAVSGGPDSMVLCRVLSFAGEGADGINIHALTVDHGLRAEASEEAELVGEWVKGWPCVKHAVLTRKAVKGKTKIQEQAREDRYRLLARYCRDHGIETLFLAHPADDQAETILFRLAMGSGIDGLAGMQSRMQHQEHGLMLCRPFLGITKEDLVACCRAENIPYVTDPSNKNPHFARIRLRQSSEILAREGLSAKRLFVFRSWRGPVPRALQSARPRVTP